MLILPRLILVVRTFILDAYKRCLSYCFPRSVDECAFTKPFGYIFNKDIHRTVIYFLVYDQDKEKLKDIKNVMSFRGTVVSACQLYKPLAEKHKCRKYSN